MLDTWFSSGQWAYATLMKYNLLEEFYPTNVMVNAHDILELWDSRMIMLSLYTFSNREIEKAIPFKDVYLTGLVKARDGQKMSKSKGNGVVPDELFEKYGVDATRMFFYHGNSAGRGYPINDEKLLNMKKFANKIWNASKYIFSCIEKFDDLNSNTEIKEFKEFSDRVNTVKKDVLTHIENFEFGYASEDLYESFWHDYCDQMIELSKKYIASFGETTGSVEEKKYVMKVMYESLITYLKLLHPMMPFITEKIWQSLPEAKGSLMFEKI